MSYCAACLIKKLHLFGLGLNALLQGTQATFSEIGKLLQISFPKSSGWFKLTLQESGLMPSYTASISLAHICKYEMFSYFVSSCDSENLAIIELKMLNISKPIEHHGLFRLVLWQQNFCFS